MIIKEEKVMKLRKRIFAVVYFTLCFIMMFGMVAYAYIDPATTSYLIQIVAGVFIAGGAAVGIFWKKIRLFIRDKRMKMLEKKLSKEAEKKQK